MNQAFIFHFLCKTDYDECAAPDLNKCHVMAICTNTLGSYNCTCLDGYLGNGFLCQGIGSKFAVISVIL